MKPSFSERVRAAALALPEAYEDAPWGFPVFKVANNRLFAWMQERDRGAVEVTLKMDDEMRLLALGQPHVAPASHLGRYGWVRTLVDSECRFEEMLGWLEESWWLRAPKRLRQQVESLERED
jgi:predicted DNA-binding protein (MmcQ/YjbR family)